MQDQDINNIKSERRNPIIADLFHRMRYMERRGSGLRKIVNETAKLPGYTEEYRPAFYSTPTSFTVVIKNVNYNLVTSDQVVDQVSDQDITIEILRFCETAKSKREICEHFGYSNLTYFTKKYLSQLLDNGLLLPTESKPNSRNQKYIKA